VREEAGVSDLPGSPAAFHYHRSIAPMMWVFFGFASVELVVVHALLSHWYPTLALVLSALTLASILWLIGAIRSFKRLPVLIDVDTLVMRVGWLKSFRVPLADIAGRRESWTGEELNTRRVANLALIAWPNIWIDLARPQGRREITAIAHKLDDPEKFRAAVDRLVDPRGGLALSRSGTA
jgi:hypothetical protein